MRIICTPPHPRLAPYLTLIWNFESSNGVAPTDARLIVPDGRIRIIIPYKSATQAMVGDRLMHAKVQQIVLAGMQTQAVTIGSTSTDVGTIGIELTAKGAYHLLGHDVRELVNRLVTFEDIFGAWGSHLQRRVANTEDPSRKISILQHSLLQLLDRTTRNFSFLDYVTDEISNSHGNISMRALQKNSGYSGRYMDMLFREYVGLSPKTYARILRFQSMHRLLVRDNLSVNKSLHTYYYDQSHFIKEFKSFTGFTPIRYRKIINNFGKTFSIET